MTERSWFWDGIVTGDATLAPYTSDELTDVYKLIGEFSRHRPHLLSTIGGVEDFRVNYSGTSITVSPGYLKIDGKIFRLKKFETFDCSTAGYYRLVLRKRFASYSTPEQGGGSTISGGQNVRLALLYSPIDPASATLDLTLDDGVKWEQNLGFFYSNGNVVYPYRPVLATDAASTTSNMYDRPDMWIGSGYYMGLWSHSRNSVKILSRQGGSATHWATAGTTQYVVGQSKIEVGKITVAGNPQAVTFVEAFAYNPIVIITINEAGSWAGNNHCISAISTTGFSVRFDSTTNLAAFNYMAIGPEY